MKSAKESKLNLKIPGLLWLAAIGTQGSWYKAAGTSLLHASPISVI